METISLFDFPVGMPLAARVRPQRLEDLLGQTSVVDPSGPISAYLQGLASLPSLIVFGPPGTGKTTLARIISSLTGRRLREISAINSSISELRDAFESSRSDIESGLQPHIVFIDEIHRFSKVQQESLLRSLEQGEVVLIGATTENPRFALTPALVSRCMLLELNPLGVNELKLILAAAIQDERGLAGKFSCVDEVLEAISAIAGGDARKALTVLETASVTAQAEGRSEIELNDVSKNMSIALARYDADGDQHYDIISAFIKSVRGSDVDSALHYLARMLIGGEDPRFIARRLSILAAEDIGLADPFAVTMANSVMQIVAQIGMPEARIPMAELAIYLSLAPKSNSAYLAINKAIEDVQSGFAPQIPAYLRSNPAIDSTTAYDYPHDDPNKIVGQKYLSAEHRPYYVPQHLGEEGELAQRFARIAEIRAKLGL